MNINTLKESINQFITHENRRYIPIEMDKVADDLTHLLEFSHERELAQKVLKFSLQQKQIFVKDPNAIPDVDQRLIYKNTLKKLKTAALSIFREEIEEQRDYLSLLQKKFVYLKDNNQLKDLNFIENQLVKWGKD